jgi:[acyl-carrier-protein] S-malonyltransferase
VAVIVSTDTMMLAVLCSGQGGQHPGMFRLTGEIPAAARLFEHATPWFGQDPRTWVLCAGEQALQANKGAQLLCALQALAVATALDHVLPRERCIAGYSVGEMAAWSLAGLLDAKDALDLTVARAEAMDSARRGPQGMLFVRGLSRSLVEQLLEHREAAVAIVNPGSAYVLAGTLSALHAIAADAQRHGAARVVPVGVEVASHTYLMAEATAVFRERLARTHVENTPRFGSRLLCGIDGELVLTGPQSIDKLAMQISQTIEWAACLEACVEAGAVAFLEIGPGRALADMAASAYPAIPARSVDDFKSIDGVRTWLARVG